MKYLALFAQIVLGLLFLTFGLNYFLKFLPPELIPLPSTEEAKEFMKLLAASGYLDVVMGLQIVGGLALISVKWTNLGMLILGPIIVNIALYHFLLAKGGYELPGIIGVLTLIILVRHADEWKSALS